MTPFTINTVKLLGIGVVCVIVGYLIPSFSNVYINISVKAMILSLSYAIMIYKFKISEDVNQLVGPWLGRFF
jgi:hypothetical protein